MIEYAICPNCYRRKIMQEVKVRTISKRLLVVECERCSFTALAWIIDEYLAKERPD